MNLSAKGSFVGASEELFHSYPQTKHIVNRVNKVC